MPITVYAARMKYLVVAPLLVAVLVMQGCATTQSNTTYLNVYSNPAGAAIALDNEKPSTFGWRQIRYNSAEIAATGCTNGGKLTAVWKSGATAVINPVRLCNGPEGSYSITMERPTNAPNLSVDLELAEAYKKQQAALAQRERADDSNKTADAFGAALLGFSEGMNNRRAETSRTRPTNTNCKSRVNISGNIITDCHSY
jgi:hypothetical protein